MNETYFGLGIACIVAAIVGGGTKLFGYEIPVVDSLRRQLLLAGFGLALAGAASFSVWGPPLQRLESDQHRSVQSPVPLSPTDLHRYQNLWEIGRSQAKTISLRRPQLMTAPEGGAS